MIEPAWTAVDDHLATTLIPTDPVLDAVLESAETAGLPAHHVSPLQGRLLQLLAELQGARRILEIGTLAGYSTICLARSLPPDGLLITLESDPGHAAVARRNFVHAGVQKRVELHEGAALDTLPALHAKGAGPFDFVFIDADKPNNPAYLRWALSLTRSGSLIVADNVVRDGAILDSKTRDPPVSGVREFLAALGAETRLCATAIQMVGCKGWDGFAVARVRTDGGD